MANENKREGDEEVGQVMKREGRQDMFEIERIKTIFNSS